MQVEKVVSNAAKKRAWDSELVAKIGSAAVSTISKATSFTIPVVIGFWHTAKFVFLRKMVQIVNLCLANRSEAVAPILR